ncbi:MAG TPA: hypothetical protein VK625_06390, partial [Flavitalea sp.]|nr:hypothetical protein [Flavitalea sp.]
MSWVAVGIGGATLVSGIITNASNKKRQRQAQEKLEKLNTPKTQSSATVDDYYRQAQASPSQTIGYKLGQQNIQRGMTAGLAGLQDRRAGLAGISGLVRQSNDASL